MDKSLAKIVHSGDIVGVSKVNVGDFVIFTQDFMTKQVMPQWPKELIAPAGTKGWVVAIEAPEKTHYEVRVDLAGSGDCRWAESEIIEPFEPDDFDRAWLSHDYETARRLYDSIS